MITYSHAKTSSDLHDILALQKKNLRENLSEVEISSQGFVYIKHDLDQLTKMNHPYAHAIAKDGEKIIAYALVLIKEQANDVPILHDLFEVINCCSYQGKILKDLSYFIMGQVCIAKEYRGKNVFRGLYNSLNSRMRKHFDYSITEVSIQNRRSLRAHEKIGFEKLIEHTDDLAQTWRSIILKL